MSDQLCGHPAACIVSHGETHHCGWCEAVGRAVIEQARADRLARILAVERGDASAAPDGWKRDGGEWSSTGGLWMVMWGGVGVWKVIDFALTPKRPHFRTDLYRGTALEAMEAADAARGE